MSAVELHDRLLGMVLGPIIWAVHFLFVYIFQAVGCSLDLHRRALLGFNLIDVVLVGGTLALLALIVWGGVRSLHGWQRYGAPQPDGGAGTGEAALAKRRVFLAKVAFGLYVLSMVAVMWVTLPVLLLPDPCRS